MNRRVLSLKTMDSELENSIQTSLLQHEVEACLFEQNSCARLEEFWVEQRSKMHNLAKSIKDAQVDYDIARSSGAVKKKRQTGVERPSNR